MPSPTARALVLGLAAALLAGCAKSPRALYLDALDAQTHKMVVSWNLGTALRLRGTYLSPSFRRTLAEERQRLTGVTDDDHAAFLDRMARDAEAYHEVVFTAESDIERKTRFSDTDDHWRLRLEVDGRVQPLIAVEKVAAPSALHTELYAHKNLWNTLWIARFDRVDEPRASVSLHVGSGYGHDTLTWTADQLR